MGIMSVVGEIWANQDHPRGRVITRQYTDPECVGEDGQPVLFVEFGSTAFTYVYAELADLGWRRTSPPTES